MSHVAPSTFSLRPSERINQGEFGEIRGESQRQSLRTPSIHTLDDDSLLHLFYLYRPPIFDGGEDDESRNTGGNSWARERWWHELVHVCQRWRRLIFRSASYLGLCLVCTYGTRVAGMLAHSPPLPLVIDYPSMGWEITAQDEQGIILALEQRNRVCRVRLGLPVSNFEKAVKAIDGEYPVLQYLIMGPMEGGTALTLPERFQAPHLCHLLLKGFALPMGSRLLTTTAGMVTLCLLMNHSSAYFQPNILLQWLSFMPQLETLLINFLYYVPDHDVERELIYTNMTNVTLPNLRTFGFRGVSAYMGVVAPWLTTPVLEKLGIDFFNQLTFSVPRQLQFMETSERLRFDSGKFDFLEGRVSVGMYIREEAKAYAFSMNVFTTRFDWQVSFVAQIFNSLGQISSTVEHLNLAYNRSYQKYNVVDRRTEWRKLFRSFSNVKTLRVEHGLVEELSCCLRLEDGEHPMELLAELQELTYSASNDIGDAFTSFIDARRNAGRPVTLAHLYEPSV